MVGDAVAPETLGRRRHGVLLMRSEDTLRWTPTRTRRGARRKFAETADWLPLDPARAGVHPGNEVTVIRVERGREAGRLYVRPLGEPPPEAGVREPRRPLPRGGRGTAALD